MTEFKEQGGPSTMDPPAHKRWIASQMLTNWVSYSGTDKRRIKHEKQRVDQKLPHHVEYFHFVDDPYSYLTAQILQTFSARYNIQLTCHLVSKPPGDNAPEFELLMNLARYDAYMIAEKYGLSFEDRKEAPKQDVIDIAQSILAAQDDQSFTSCVAEVSHAMWSDDKEKLLELSKKFGFASSKEASEVVARGDARRAELKHYSGAMLYYAGEWYWGIDRLYHLENRLSSLGADRLPSTELIAPRPKIVSGPLKDSESLTLEIFPTLRSPYSAIAFDRAVALAEETGVNLSVRLVLPMVMRGVPTTTIKGQYIFWDTGREARAAGIPFGKIYDPVGDPVRRCCSLIPWAETQGKHLELIRAFYQCAFVEGINTNNNRGLRKVVENAGLSWQEAKKRIGDPEGAKMLERNRLALLDAGIWGTPSFRLLDSNGAQILALWGQDRLWRVADEIQQQFTKMI